MQRLFDELRFYNSVLSVEYHIADTLNYYLAKNNKINDWDELKERFLEKIKRNWKIKKVSKAEELLDSETNGKRERILTPNMMFYVAGYGLGELVGYIDEFTTSFPNKKELLDKLTKFNTNRKTIIHNLVSSREDAEKKIIEGIALGKEITDLIDKITNKDN